MIAQMPHMSSSHNDLFSRSLHVEVCRFPCAYFSARRKDGEATLGEITLICARFRTNNFRCRLNGAAPIGNRRANTLREWPGLYSASWMFRRSSQLRLPVVLYL